MVVSFAEVSSDSRYARRAKECTGQAPTGGVRTSDVQIAVQAGDFNAASNPWHSLASPVRSCATSCACAELNVRVSKPEAGLDDQSLRRLAHDTLEIHLALQSRDFCFLEPCMLSAALLQHPRLGADRIAQLLTDSLTQVAGFFAHSGHWALVVYDVHARPPAIYYDGIPCRLLRQAEWILRVMHDRIGTGPFVMRQLSIVEQTHGDHCGAIAVANLRWHLNQAFNATEAQLAAAMPACLAEGSFFGRGATDHATVHAWLVNYLQPKGVPAEKAQERATMALKKLGLSAVAKCMSLPNPWRALKELGNQQGRQFQWVTYEELQTHILSQSKLPRGDKAVDRPSKPQKTHKQQKPEKSVILAPDKLVIPSAAFVDPARCGLEQLRLDDISSAARGVIAVTLDQAMPFLHDSKSLSVDALALLTVQPVPAEVTTTLNVQALRWPAIYAGTNEPILICGSIIQLGDEPVAKVVEEGQMPKTVSTCLLRVQVYRDQFTGTWEDFIKGPVRCLCHAHPCLQKCSAVNCGVTCPKFHAPVDEEVDGVVLDAFAWRWFKTDGKPESPVRAASFAVLLRVPATASKAILDLSGTDGVYVELRADSGNGPHPDYSVIWLAHDSFDSVMHRKRTFDKVQGIARLHAKYGLRVKTPDEQQLRSELFPGQQFVSCKITEVFEVGPFPHGSTKQAIQTFLVGKGWTAHALRPIRSALDGRFWEVGAESHPPAPIFSMGVQDITITHARSRQHPVPGQANVLASARTMRHLQQRPSDPWDASDPWKSWLEAKGSAPAAATQEASSSKQADSKLADLEQRLKLDLEAAVKHQVRELQQDVDMAEAQTETASQHRLVQLEADVQELRAQSKKFESWFQDAGDQVAGLKQQVGTLATKVQEQMSTTDSLHQMMGSMQASLQHELQNSMAQQTERLEALLSKQRRTA